MYSEYEPAILIGDADAVITNGFCKAFDYNPISDEYMWIMCWAHANINLDEK